MSDDTPLPSRTARVSRKVIRSVLVPVGLSWFFGPVPVHRLPRLVDLTVPEFVALWFYGIILLGALSLGARVAVALAISPWSEGGEVEAPGPEERRALSYARRFAQRRARSIKHASYRSFSFPCWAA